MGWYIELQIGKRTQSWRKQIPSELSLLFLKNAEMVELPIKLANDEEQFAGFKSTVARVIGNLDEIGITSNYFISLYAQYREWIVQYLSSYYEGMLQSFTLIENDNDEFCKHRAKQLQKEVIAIQNSICQSSASHEYISSVELLKCKELPTWESYSGEEPPLLPSPFLEKPSTLLDDRVLYASLIGDFLEYANNNLPEIAWLFETRLILDASPRNASVKLNLSEWIYEGGVLHEWIPSALDNIVSKVRAYSLTFETIVSSNIDIKQKLARQSLSDRWKVLQLDNLTSYQKGRALEEFFATAMESTSDLPLIAKNLYTETQELDILIKNAVQSPFWIALSSPLIFIECKNWSSPVGTKEARIFESKLRDTGKFCQIGLFVALGGVTEPFLTHINSLRRDNYVIAVITKQDIVKFLESLSIDVTQWLEKIIIRAAVGDKLGD